MAITPLAILVSSLFFIIRGYGIADGKLYVRRLIWDTGIDLDDLQSLTVDYGAMKRSIRIFGNRSLFCFSGLFRNRKLGKYHAYASDPKSAVVLILANRSIVVTPNDPATFVNQVVTHFPCGAAEPSTL